MEEDVDINLRGTRFQINEDGFQIKTSGDLTLFSEKDLKLNCDENEETAWDTIDVLAAEGSLTHVRPKRPTTTIAIAHAVNRAILNKSSS